MQTNSDNMRSIINLIESVDNDQSLEEDPIINRFANRMLSKIGSKRASGRVERDQLGSQMRNGFNTWVGKTGRKATMDDVHTYLSQQIGFTPDQIKAVTGIEPKSAPQAPVQEPAAPAGQPPQQDANTGSAQSATPEPNDTETNSVPVDNAAPQQRPLSAVKADKQRSYDKMNYHDAKAHETSARGLNARAATHQQARDQHKNDYQKHRDELKARGGEDSPTSLTSSRRRTGNTLMELNLPSAPLNRTQVSDIFNKAAEYVFDNNLQSNTQGSGTQQPQQQNQQSNNSGGSFGGYNRTNQGSPAQGNQSNPSNQNSQGSQQAQGNQSNQISVDNVFSLAAKEGLDDSSIATLRQSAQKVRSSAGISDQNQQKDLLKVGFAFLKSLN